MKLLLILLLLPMSLVGGEVFSDRIKGLRVVGSVEAGFPVVILDSTVVTVWFDLNETHPADFRLRVYHCDRDWKKTASTFINNDTWNLVRVRLPFSPAPPGVQHYRFQYRFSLPGLPGLERFIHSGNYVFEIWDEEGTTLLVRGKFVVVEPTLSPSMRVSNRQAPEADSPLNQVHVVELRFVVPEFHVVRTGLTTFGTSMVHEREEREILHAPFFSVVDIYKNRELVRSYRIDTSVRTRNTFVDGVGTRRLRFRVENVLPGNEYRRLDLRNAAEYPPGRDVRPRHGADLSRMFLRAGQDNNGLAVIEEGSINADYLRVTFEFLPQQYAGEPLDVVGDFNGWTPSPSARMRFDHELGRYVWSTWLRRGVYDYQYVLNVDDWVALEGNDWRTSNVYSAVVYYRDQRFGGFDRILGFRQIQSSGLTEAHP